MVILRASFGGGDGRRSEGEAVRIGIVGARLAGKTTLFNSITGQALPTGQGGVEAHRAVAEVPDPRLARLSAMFRPRRTVPAQVEWVDIPGLDLGPGGNGRGFLEHGRRMDALVLVARGFDDGLGAPQPAVEKEALAAELALADLQVVENRLERLVKERQKVGKRFDAAELELLEGFRTHLEQGRPLRELELDAAQRRLIVGYSFLTLKPLLDVLNLPEGRGDSARPASRNGSIEICAKVEAEIAQLPEQERAQYLAELGIDEPALHRLIRAAYAALGLQSFFTVGEDECRAWTVRVGALAPEAAGVVHSDLARGFIRAEVCTYEELIAAGGLSAVKRANQLRLEGKGYVVRDGDVLSIRFAV
jgi:GTP-binding protein YchF